MDEDELDAVLSSVPMPESSSGDGSVDPAAATTGDTATVGTSSATASKGVSKSVSILVNPRQVIINRIFSQIELSLNWQHQI